MPNSRIFFHENALENIVCEMAAILSRGNESTNGLAWTSPVPIRDVALVIECAMASAGTLMTTNFTHWGRHRTSFYSFWRFKPFCPVFLMTAAAFLTKIWPVGFSRYTLISLICQMLAVKKLDIYNTSTTEWKYAPPPPPTHTHTHPSAAYTCQGIGTVLV